MTLTAHTLPISVDLKLAETYVPICLSLLKCTCLVCVQYTLHVSTAVGHRGNAICVMLLLLDRLLQFSTISIIVDTNGLCWFVLVAYMILIPAHPYGLLDSTNRLTDMLEMQQQLSGGWGWEHTSMPVVVMSILLMGWASGHLLTPCWRSSTSDNISWGSSRLTQVQWLHEAAIPLVVSAALALMVVVKRQEQESWHNECIELGIKSFLFIGLTCTWIYSRLFCLRTKHQHQLFSLGSQDLTPLAGLRFCAVFFAPHVLAIVWSISAIGWMGWTCMQHAERHSQKNREDKTTTPLFAITQQSEIKGNCAGDVSVSPSSTAGLNNNSINGQEEELRMFMETKAKMMMMMSSSSFLSNDCNNSNV